MVVQFWGIDKNSYFAVKIPKIKSFDLFPFERKKKLLTLQPGDLFISNSSEHVL